MNDQSLVNILKGLVIDGVNKAKSGHPGGAMSSMDFAYILFTEYLNFDPKDPSWSGRDRFILSAGHESMLMYSLLFANGWLPMSELESFRQWGSKTPGHPENHLTPGVECTTGPLGQGAAMSVGFSIASTHLRETLDAQLFGYNTYAVLGDGCIQEDITLGAASLAGHLKLSNLIWYYDKNKIQISGDINRAASDNDAKVFEGFGWNVIEIDGHDHAAIRRAIEAAQKENNAPTLIIGKTTIAKGAASLEGSAKTHGSPLPADERVQTKAKLGLPEDEFYWPSEAQEYFRRNFARKEENVASWSAHLEAKLKDGDFAKQYKQYFGDLDASQFPVLDFPVGESIPSRNVFGKVVEAWSETAPSLIGGSADLEPSNMTHWFKEKVGDFSAENPRGRNIVFGVREFPMSAICNGIALHGGLVPFDATFLVFSDYSRAALRLGALQEVRVIHEFTHDSFYLGEDGPTHQPIEHIMSLRAMPNMLVMRPADATETTIQMQQAALAKSPSIICLSRQNLTTLDLSSEQKENIKKGAYILKDVENPELIIMATGSEVHLALEVANKLTNMKIRVVSMPCWEFFEAQDSSYKESVLPSAVTKRVSIEAGVTLGWQKYTGMSGLNIGIDHFGASAPADVLAKQFGFTAEAICSKIDSHSF